MSSFALSQARTEGMKRRETQRGSGHPYDATSISASLMNC